LTSAMAVSVRDTPNSGTWPGMETAASARRGRTPPGTRRRPRPRLPPRLDGTTRLIACPWPGERGPRAGP
jgi:hypothetical protein